ncbi:MAG: DUF2252 domain-containing protein [Alphaproteobacteria bacterium]
MSKAGDTLLGHIDAGQVFVPRHIFTLDMTREGESWQSRLQIGRGLREQIPLEAHGEWKPAKERPDPLKVLAASNKGRQKHLVPLRMARMAASPFAFLRGAAGVMAWDLAKAPSAGLNVVIDGDAHYANFGLFGNAEKNVVVDLNDFDEATIGPWEWDLKRLTASISVMGRDNKLSRKERRRAVRRCVSGYRWNLRRFESMPILDVWYIVAAVENLQLKEVVIDKKSQALIDKALSRAKESNNAKLLNNVAERSSTGKWRFKVDPPILTQVDDATRDAVMAGLREYLESMTPERRYMLRRYHVVDVAHRVVGVGSVGTRAYLVLLMGNGDQDPLFLQIKEAARAAHAPYVAPLPEDITHEGKRVVFGQKVLQAAGDPLLGWTTIKDRPFYVRQMRNLKAGIDTSLMSGQPLELMSWGRGALLARAHARAGDAATISGYCGDSDEFDDAMADWAEAYADQTEKDHAALVKAIRAGKIEAAVID